MCYRFLAVVTLICRIVTSRLAEKDVADIPNGLPVNDPLFKLQELYLEFAGVSAAWERMASSSVNRKRVTVALVDSGVRPDHPDLVRNLVLGYNVINNTTDTPDKRGHATTMAGVLGATINNSIGIAGVMDLVNILPISLEGVFTDKAEAYAIRNKNARGIKIILMAMSRWARRPQLETKIKQAIAAGMLVIVTAGNNNKDITENKKYPCALTGELPGILCVAATDNTRMKLAVFSNYADYLDIAAPGQVIMTTLANKDYNDVEGTSPAAAVIAVVAAMLYSINPNLSPVEVQKILKDTSRKGITRFPGIPQKFWLVDADAAVAKLLSRNL